MFSTDPDLAPDTDLNLAYYCTYVQKKKKMNKQLLVPVNLKNSKIRIRIRIRIKQFQIRHTALKYQKFDRTQDWKGHFLAVTHMWSMLQVQQLQDQVGVLAENQANNDDRYTFNFTFGKRIVKEKSL